MFCGDDGPDSPVIPSNMKQLRMCRWRESRSRWHRVSPDRNYGEEEFPPSTFELVTWNVSFDTPMVRERMDCVLRHLERVVFKCRDGEAPEPCVVLLQEVHAPHGLDVILKDEWVREHFLVAPVETSQWPEGAAYGNVTLVEKSIPVHDAHILDFGVSEMQRTGLMVDIRLGAPKPHDYDVILRVANTHLESLRGAADRARPLELQLLTKFIKGPGVRGGLIAGDMNPIGPMDASIPTVLGLRDAWRKGDKDERGFTWGQQPPREFPAARFDKVLYLPRKGFRVDEPQRIGVGLKLSSERLPGGISNGCHSSHSLSDTMMNSLLFAAALIAGAAAQLTINTPSGTNSAAECEPFAITWSGGVGASVRELARPFLFNFPISQHPTSSVTTSPAGTTPIATFNDETGTTQTWTVNATVGASLLFGIRDSTGVTATTAAFQVVTGSGDSCLTAGASSDTTTGATTAGTTTAGTTTAGATTAATTGTTTSPAASKATGSTSAAASKASSSSTTSSSAGQAVSAPAGVLPAFVAVLGAGLIALLA
ncbi:hypothetical protein DFH07DRAFT_959095 [Mycena maculata]|uniref:Endonuclease/exonuclease/phosphatase domain-containing protein n=1 Tax=Mycena maculata TaxID=230809 RepID=A0AAD7J513_9AGAR|nr:hypothetical protein DFH07DRAFT_959095 [Mycena maculata]